MAGFLAMGGYAFYVWGSYGVVALALALEVALLRRRHRTLLRRLGRMHRMRGAAAAGARGGAAGGGGTLGGGALRREER
ncbi:MAG: heme exporter protein CcmD [Gammaproteobacteria bacterium]|nr:MAG: heme exporter protein CcmD [Gammaproteobacteria bacterium]